MTTNHGNTAHSHGAVPEAPDAARQSRAARIRSTDPNAYPVIGGREEEWRFTPLDRLRGLDTMELTGPAPELSIQTADGVSVEQVARDDKRIGLGGLPDERIAASAWSSFEKATVLTVGKEVEAVGESSLTFTGSSMEPAASHVVVKAEPFSKAVVVLDYHGSSVLSENVEIVVGDSAELTLVSIQDWDDDAVHMAAHHSSLGRDSKLKHIAITLGGDLVRLTPNATYEAEGGELEMLGVYFADEGQHLEQRLFVDHATPNCTSNVKYKGALQGDGAHTIWVGDVLIRPSALGINTYELNRNLVLTKGARADSVPDLEIETGEIEGAGHASATGRFDEEHLFYLMSRGVPEIEARRLVVRGFFNEVIQQIRVPSIVDRLSVAIEDELARSMQ
ncbi:Fe-S cluster assembly protein SufD [Spelaeicoccus albus]|uniref:Fe-S cluster assembly protein SufD n=1 Tax=Spelaeicoccus albus TaxID=1280376 RepID=A0A7Z0D436_9MICO|nr:Fe-S cluster assembly protein SufD [Spelaeicoccus albus]NYI68517.1 Fe-S cluster assembly protein SufD [Spelaeicoccus albus]